MITFPSSSLVQIGGGIACALMLSGCGDEGSTSTAGGDRLSVVASFYPLQFAAERVGGDHVQVENLTKPGAEPHDLELAPADVGRLAEADLVVFLHGFQPAVDDAVESEAGDAAYDVAPDARLGLTAPADTHGKDGHEGEEEGDESEESHDEEAGTTDPHFWLDPTRLADVADALAEQLATLDEANAEDYRDNAAALRADLEALDAEMTAGLASCASTDLVTSHSAFGYLADRYGFEQEGLSGLSPEDEPSPKDLAEVSEFVTEHDVATIYYETLVSPAIADTVAQETGARTAVLDPIEGLSDTSAGGDYLEVMRANLTSLQTGQSCT